MGYLCSCDCDSLSKAGLVRKGRKKYLFHHMDWKKKDAFFKVEPSFLNSQQPVLWFSISVLQRCCRLALFLLCYFTRYQFCLFHMHVLFLLTRGHKRIVKMDHIWWKRPVPSRRASKINTHRNSPCSLLMLCSVTPALLGGGWPPAAAAASTSSPDFPGNGLLMPKSKRANAHQTLPKGECSVGLRGDY